MTNYRAILEYHYKGNTTTQVARICECSRTTVLKTIKRAKECGLTKSSVAGMNDFKLLCKLYPNRVQRVEYAIIYQGDTIANPQNVEDGKLMQFQCIVANPPFSLDKWANGYAADSNDKDFKMSKELDPYKRFDWGVPPKSKGDYAFILHMLHCLDGNNKRKNR